ncbi:hypothetical protein [Paraburkholderia antibiotica]|uniref:Uncharacterized protein n=1 Tax=Paraburkholderia antibiotica TaxID=2728839 RepID=A0A7Y0A2Q5_9BURK|nr:hypothetical protein [Paraburkholderia antibiotica]NML35369.1 hypothetical protein [Paraburkholderia antibiotica]
MLNWDDEITAITDVEARMLGGSLEAIHAIVKRHAAQQDLQNPIVSATELRDRLVRIYEELVSCHRELVIRSYQRRIGIRRLAAIFRRWMGERRTRFLNACRTDGQPTLMHRTTRSAAANMRLVAPIGAPPRSA